MKQRIKLVFVLNLSRARSRSQRAGLVDNRLCHMQRMLRTIEVRVGVSLSSKQVKNFVGCRSVWTRGWTMSVCG